MLHLVPRDRIYTPETLALMTAAFDRVFQSVSHRMNGNEALKQALAEIILRLVDRGERDPERLAEDALHEWTGSERSATVIARGLQSARSEGLPRSRS
jgi:hypothetical protein